MIARRNVRLYLGFRALTRAILFAPYIFQFMTAVRGMTAAEYGLLQGLYYYVVVLAEVPSGVFADRLGRKTALLAGAVANAAGCFGFALSHSFFSFAVGELLFALGTALVSGADSALLYDTLAAEGREAEYPRWEGAAQATWLLLSAVGFVLTDRFLVRGADPLLAYWTTGAMSLAGAAVALFLREPPLRRRLTTREITFGAAADLVKVPGVLRIIVYSVGVFVLLRAATVSFYNPALAALKIPVHHYGRIFAAVNVAGGLAAWGAHRFLSRHGERVFLWGMPVSLLSMYVLLCLVRVPAAAGLFVVQGVVFGVHPLIVRSLLNRRIPSPDRRATVLSFESLLCRVATGLVVAFAGVALHAWGLVHALAATALLGCIPFAALPFLRRARPDV